MIGLCDANSFFSSCERVFRPDLKNKPIVVLSNNDGIVVAADKMAKNMGFTRGKAWFEIEKEAEERGVYAFSSNYTLYQDLSNRIMSILERECPNIEQYSIDEAFIYPPKDMKAKDLRRIVTDSTGIPTSVGFAKTKTLVKIASKLAKKRADGAYTLDSENEDEALKKTALSDVWGVGWAWEKDLYKKGFRTAKDLRDCDLDYFEKRYPITLIRTIYELRGVEAHVESDRHISFMSGISFKDSVSDIDEMISRLSIQAENLSKKLSKNGYLASSFGVNFFTSRFIGEIDRPYGSLILNSPSNYTPTFVEAIERLTPVLFKEGMPYRGCRVFAFDLIREEERQISLFENGERVKKEESMSHIVSEIMGKYGRSAIHIASSKGRLKEDLMKRERKSQNYTTDFNELAEVY